MVIRFDSRCMCIPLEIFEMVDVLRAQVQSYSQSFVQISLTRRTSLVLWHFACGKLNSKGEGVV